MDYLNLFNQFSRKGRLSLPDAVHNDPEDAIPGRSGAALGLDGAPRCFEQIPWSAHPTYEGVELKHLITSCRTGGEFSFHLVRIAPGRKIGRHVHERQLETHEVIAGSGFCMNEGTKLVYEPGVISIFRKNMPHEVTAGPEGLFLFAKFFPALN